MKALIPRKLRVMLKRMSIVPFEMAIAALLIISGMTGFLHFGITDPLSLLIPMWEQIILNGLSVLSGVFLAAGVSADSGRFEMAGLLFLNGVILSRFLLYGHYFGYGNNFLQTGLFDLAVIVASLARGRTIRKKHVLVKFRHISSLEDYNNESS